MQSDPYCSNCSYSLKGLTESSKCPECGKPLVEVLTRKTFDLSKFGRRYKSKIMLFGLPLIHIALGPDEDGPHGKAKGILAIGDQALGFVALGGKATGIVAIGGFARGVCCFGGLSIGLLSCGGWALGLLASGGLSIGLFASGGLACGWLAFGGMAIGVYAGGGATWGSHTANGGANDPQAVAVLTNWSWLMGNSPLSGMFTPMAWILGVMVVLSGLIALMMLVAYLRHDHGAPT
ncbi:MAG: hypothetical protein IID34_15395 [Planctomycetes bacterium]|nr:hypothetical protein [Planctomycetota bacterium]